MSANAQIGIPFIGQGRPVVSVVTRPSASPAEEFAADEIRRILSVIAGKSPAIGRSYRPLARIILNHPDDARAAGIPVPDLAPVAFHLRTDRNNLYVFAGSPRAVLYAVYEILERLGCRWYAPDEEFIPRLRSASLPPMDFSDAPAFEYRDNNNTDTGDPLWWVRNRMNGQFPHVPDYLGGQVRYGMFVHTFDKLVPPEELFDSHPEYFSMVNGARLRENTQLCLTNPDVLDLLTTRLLRCIEDMPDATIFSVSQNDFYNFCECPSCAAVAAEEGAQSGPLLRFVNAVAERTSRRFPDKLIDTLAYAYSLEAPRRVTPHPNVRVRLCPIQCCQAHRFGDCDHPESLRNLAALKAWSRITDRLYIWHYCTDFKHYLTPMPDLDELHANINLYRSFRVRGIFMQGCGEAGGRAESQNLRGYLISKLLWNPDRPAWPIVDDFLAHYYGKAAPHVRTYLDLFHERVRSDRSIHPSLFDPPTQPLFAGDIIQRADHALAQGERLAAGRHRARTHLLRLGLTYTRLFRTVTPFKLEHDTYHGCATAADLDECDRLYRELKHLGVEHIDERFSIDTSIHKLRGRLLHHPVHWLRDEHNEIAVVPTLGGRLVVWNTLDHQWLAQPELAYDKWKPYPTEKGYYENAVLGAWFDVGWADAFRVSRADQSAITLSAHLERNLRLSRTYRLRKGVLHIDSRLTNLGPTPTSASWGGCLHLRLPAPASLSYASAADPDTRFTWDQLPDALSRIWVLEKDRTPLGLWTARGDAFTVTHRFTCDRLAAAATAREPNVMTLALFLRSHLVPLAPKASIRAHQEIAITPT